jgi:tetratricopeptide (TPR) repeat protein
MGSPRPPQRSDARRLRRAARRCAALLIAGAALGAAPRPARADRISEAEALFREGRRLLDEGRRDQACARFAESQRLSPSPGALLNLGDCHQQEGKLATAWAEFLAAARLYTDPGNQAERDFCLREAALIEPHLSRLTLRLGGPVPGLLLRRNGEPVDAAQIDVPVPVDPGVYVVTAEAPGRAPFQTSVLIRAQKSEVTVIVPPLAPRLADAPPAAGRPTLDYVIGGLGVAAFGTGATFGVLALVNNHKAENRCPDGRCPPGSPPQVQREAGELYDRASTQAWVANVGLGLGLVAGGYLLFFAPSKPKVGSTSGGRTRVAVAPGPGGLTLCGQF